MFGKTHSEETKNLMSAKRIKHPQKVGIYDLDGKLVKSFNTNVDLADYLNISKVTVGKYLNSGLIYKNRFYFKVNSS
jgi:group I intron endonuclease